MGYLWCVCVDSKHANNGKVYITGVFFTVVKSKHVNSIGFSYLWSSTKKRQAMGFDVCMEDTPAESKTGGTSFHHGLHPTDMQGQAKIQHPSKWADNIYSRKFGETIDEGDDNHGGGRSESTAPKKKLRICNQNFVQPKKDESKNLDDKNRDDDNCDDNNRADDHDDDDNESEKTLILGAD